jgi:hypothetical protein
MCEGSGLGVKLFGAILLRYGDCDLKYDFWRRKRRRWEG